MTRNTLNHRRLTKTSVYAFETITGFRLNASLKRERKERLKAIASNYKQQVKTLEFSTQLF